MENIITHGDQLSSKADNDVRLYFENVDGLNIEPTKPTTQNIKLNYFNLLMAKMEVDIYGGAESRTNWNLVPHTHSFKKSLSMREGSHCCTGHNSHENFSLKQQGGTFIASTPTAGQYIREMGNDSTGLGRWSWMRVEGRTIATRIICAYQPCITRKRSMSSTIAQQRRYWQLHGIRVCPRVKFREDLFDLLKQWRENGDKLILLMDANENLESGPIERMLKHPDLNMEDIISKRSNTDGPATFIRGQRQIDGAWATKDIKISAAGFLPFNFGAGDHRAIFVDIPLSSFIGTELHTIARPTARRLICNQEHIYNKYCDLLENYLVQHRVQEKLDLLAQKQHLTKTIRTAVLESIDLVIGEGMRMAEKRCRKLRMGAVPYSPELAKAGIQIKLWSLVVRHKRGKNINTRYIRRIAKQCELRSVLACTLETAITNHKAAMKIYTKLKRDALNLRRNFLNDRVNNATTEKAKREYTQILMHEESRRCWRAINNSRGKKPQNGISAVTVKENDSWKRIDTKEEVEEAIMSNNSARFHLTGDTPMMQPDTVEKIGYLADNATAHIVMEGNFTSDDNFDETTNHFLQFISQREKLPSIPACITSGEFGSYWSSARERTASSMSGRHFGHYKAAAKRTSLCNVHATFASEASQHGIFIKRWTKGLTVMLEKIENVIRVDKLRAILLMEADFNFINKLVFGHKMVQQCERFLRFPEELYGSRNNHSAVEVGVNRRLTLEILKQKRRNGAIAGVDAAQCYDRIVHSLAILLCRNEGAPLSSLFLMFGAIQSMEFFIRTTFGESSNFYGGIQTIPFQGSCQGNGASPALWLVLSMYIVLLYKDAGHVTNCKTAYSEIVLGLMGFLFVDDTDLVIIGNPDQSIESVTLKLQNAILCWNKLLRVTGGDLRPEKCYWYPIEFEWKKGISQIKTQTEGEVYLTTIDGKKVPIERQPPDAAMEAVGVWQDATGSNTKQLDVLLDKIRNFHMAMEKKPLPRKLCWIALKGALWRSIDYVLPAISISKQQCTRLASELYRPLLPKLGCNRNYPKLLRYNAPHFMGLGLMDPYVQQGLAKLNLFQTHAGSNSITGHLILSLMEQHQLEIGTFTPFLQLPHSEFAFLTTSSWLTELWEFINEFEIHLNSEDITTLHGSRINDKSIIETIKGMGHLPKKTLQAFNRVRCHLQVISLADIATGDGNTICRQFLDDNPYSWPSKWEWHRECPCSDDFKAWKRYLPSLLNAQSAFTQPLGKWVYKSHCERSWFYSIESDRIYHREGNIWKVYTRSINSTRSFQRYEYETICTNISSPIIPTTVTNINNDSVVCEGIAISEDYTTLPDMVHSPAHIHWALRNSNISSHINDQWLIVGLERGNLQCICDGSYKPLQHNKAIAAAWVIESNCSKHQIRGKVAITSISADAYRGELLGIYTILTTLLLLEKEHQPSTAWKLRIGCDNEKAGWMSEAISANVKSSCKHMDLVRAIRRTQNILTSTIEFFHVYGHQDNNTLFHLLSREAQLNVQVDATAQKHLEDCIIRNDFIRQPVFINEGWFVVIGGVKIQDSVSTHVQRWIDKRRLRQYLYDKGLISWTGFNQIDWDPLEKYMRHQSQEFKIWFSKHWSNFCGIGSKMKLMGFWDNDLCPCCKKVPELSTTHLFLCDDPTIIKTRNSEFGDILNWLAKVDTDPILLEIITAFWYGSSYKMDLDESYIYREVYSALKEMGVASMWMGLLPTHIVELQEQYYRLIGSRRRGINWGSEFVGKMLRASLKLWLTRNNLLHAETDSGLKGYSLIELKDLVEKQLKMGIMNIATEDHYLLDMSLDEILAGTAEDIRGWLCSILIARGDFESAKAEGKKDRGILSHTLPRLTANQQKAYLDWRKVRLNEKVGE